MSHYIVTTQHAIHDLENLCGPGENLLSSWDSHFDEYETLKEAQQTGGRPCKLCERKAGEKRRADQRQGPRV